MTQNLLLTLYNVTATLFDEGQQKVAQVHVALNAGTDSWEVGKALADISEGRSRLRAVVELYALKEPLTRIFEFNSAGAPPCAVALGLRRGQLHPHPTCRHVTDRG